MRLALALAALGGCLSEDRAQDRWEAWVAEHATCEQPEDCAVVYTECPLGCFTAVNVEFVDEAERVSDRLIDRYEVGGRACVYSCLPAGPVDCEAGACVVLPGELEG